MADERIDLILSVNEQQAVAGFQNTIKAAQQLDSEYNKLQQAGNEMFDDVTESSEEFNKQLDENVKEVAKAEKQHKKLTSEVANLRGEVDNVGVSFGGLNVTVGTLRGTYEKYKGILTDTVKVLSSSVKITATQQEGIGRLTNVLGGGRRGFTLLAKSVNLFKLGLAATGIGAFVLVVGSLVAFFTKTQAGAQKLNKVFAQLGAVVDVITDRLSGFGETIVKAFDDPKQALLDFGSLIVDNVINRFKSAFVLGESFALLLSGKFSEAASKAGEALIQFGTGLNGEQQADLGKTIGETAAEIDKEAAAAGRLSDALFKLEKREIAQITTSAKLRAELKLQNKISEDTTQSIEAREAAATKAGQISEQLLRDETALLQENLRIIRNKQALGKNSIEDDRAAAEARAAIYDKESEILELQTTLQNKLNTIRAEQKAKIDAVSASLEKLNSLVLETSLSLLPENERLAAEYEAAIQGVDDFAAEIERAAKEIGKDIDISGQVQELKDNITAEFKEKFDELKKDNPIIEPLQSIGEIKSEIPVELEVKIETPRDKGSIISDIIDSLGLSEQDLQAIGQGVSVIFSTVAQGVLNNTQLQIEQQDDLIAKINERINNTESALNRELELKKAGLANDYDLEKQNLADQTELLEKEEAKKDELRRKALEQQQIVDQLSQASSLAVAVAQIFKADSGIPIVGVISAITAIGTMIASFSSFKSQISQLREGRNMYENIPHQTHGRGTKVTGRTHEQGGELFELERDEIVMSTLQSKKNSKFLANIERGDYNQLNLLKLAESAKKANGVFQKRSATAANYMTDIHVNNSGPSYQDMKRAHVEALKETNPTLIKAFKSKSETIGLGDGRILELVRDESGQIIFERIREKV